MPSIRRATVGLRNNDNDESEHENNKEKTGHCYRLWFYYELGIRGTEHDHKLDSRTQPVGIS